MAAFTFAEYKSRGPVVLQVVFLQHSQMLYLSIKTNLH